MQKISRFNPLYREPTPVAAEISKPIYVQIQEYLAEQILSGKLPPEARIP